MVEKENKSARDVRGDKVELSASCNRGFWDVKGKGDEGPFQVARYSLSGSIPPKFERKLRRHKQRLGKINTTVVLDKGENLL